MRDGADRGHRDAREREGVGEVVAADQAAVVLHRHEVVERVLARIAGRVRTADALADHHGRRAGAGVRLAAERTAELRRISQAAGGIRAILRGAGIGHRVGHGVAPAFRAARADAFARHDRAAARWREHAGRAVLHVAGRAVGRRADRAHGGTVERQRVGEIVGARERTRVRDVDRVGQRELVRVAGRRRRRRGLHDADTRRTAAGFDRWRAGGAAAEFCAVAQAAVLHRAVRREVAVDDGIGHRVGPALAAADADRLVGHDRAAHGRSEGTKRTVLDVAGRARVGRCADRGDRRAIEGQRIGEVVAAGAATAVARGDDIGDRVLVRVAGRHRCTGRLRNRRPRLRPERSRTARRLADTRVAWCRSRRRRCRSA